MARLIITLSVILVSVYLTEQAYFLEKHYINQINAQATTWKAGENFHPKTPKEQIIRRLGSRGMQYALTAKPHEFKTHDKVYTFFNRIPKTFDARKKWKNCPTIGEIRDQGNCGSCWAFSTSSAFSDRYCIATKGETYDMLSAEELLSCCNDCGFGCYGGWPYAAWKYLSEQGLVTGGAYGSNEGCQPYRVPPCPFDDYGKSTCAGEPMEEYHNCSSVCYGNEELDYDDDHRYTRNYYYLNYFTMQKDVMSYGPIEASFNAYDDFINYKSGVYSRTKNATYLGGHSVKLIGWGVENGVPYWLMVNSWGEEWGDGGLFKIRRGKNECGIDNFNTAGIP